MEDRTVYLLQQPPHSRDLSDARRDGTIETCMLVEDRPGERPERALNRLRQIFAHAEPDDCLLFAGGDPAVPLLAGIAVNEVAPDVPLNWMRWERNRDPETGKRSGGFYVASPLHATADHE